MNETSKVLSESCTRWIISSSMVSNGLFCQKLNKSFFKIIELLDEADYKQRSQNNHLFGQKGLGLMTYYVLEYSAMYYGKL